MKNMSVAQMNSVNGGGLFEKCGLSSIWCTDCGKSISTKWCWTAIGWYNHKADANKLAKKHCKGRSCKWWNWNTNW